MIFVNQLICCFLRIGFPFSFFGGGNILSAAFPQDCIYLLSRRSPHLLTEKDFAPFLPEIRTDSVISEECSCQSRAYVEIQVSVRIDVFEA